MSDEELLSWLYYFRNTGILNIVVLSPCLLCDFDFFYISDISSLISIFQVAERRENK